MKSCLERLENMKKIGFDPKTIVDGGASIGHWSIQVKKLFPEAQLLAIEPNSLIINKAKELLEKVDDPKPIVEHSALGSENKTGYLNIWDNEETKMSGSSIKEHVQGDPKKKMEINIKKLDDIIEKYNIKPDVIKLDLQGYELEALKGSEKSLNLTEVVIVEFGCLQAYIDRTTPQELINFMYERNYFLYDIVDLIYRPHDNALTGGDFFFVKHSSNLLKYKGFS